MTAPLFDQRELEVRDQVPVTRRTEIGFTTDAFERRMVRICGCYACPGPWPRSSARRRLPPLYRSGRSRPGPGRRSVRRPSRRRRPWPGAWWARRRSSPREQALGEVEKVGTRADVFGLGALLAVMLTGQPPFVGALFEAVRVQAVRGKLEGCFARLDACGAEPELVALCIPEAAGGARGKEEAPGEGVTRRREFRENAIFRVFQSLPGVVTLP